MFKAKLRRILFVLVLNAALLRGDSFVLASGNQAQAKIVLPENPDAALAAAAEDLQKYVELICGVRLDIATDGRKLPGSALYIGDCAASLAEDKPREGLNPESFSVSLRDGSVYFNAQHPTPTAFAVYAFIEDTLGVRWYAPGELWEHIPKAKVPGTLTVELESRTVVPGTSPRVWASSSMGQDWEDWKRRNRTIPGELIPKRNFQNHLHLLFPPDKYGQSNPEFYPFYNGKRNIPSPGSRSWRPCESNPEVQLKVIESIRRRFTWYPKQDSFSLGMDDIMHFCACENCRAMDAHPDSYEKRQFSDRHYKFVNLVAKAVGETHPDRFIGTLIYSVAKPLPETVDKLEPNVFAYITETSGFWWKEGQKQRDNDLSRAWAQRCEHLSRYDYFGFASMTPRYYPKYLDAQMKFDKQLGFEGMFVEVYAFLPVCFPMIWQLAKLQWDHSLDSAAILGELRRNLYGAAEPAMTRFWDLLERSYCQERPGRGRWEHRNIVNQALAISPEDLEAAFVLLEEALASSNDAKVSQRIAIHRDALRLSEFLVKPYAMSEKMRGFEIRNQAEAEQALSCQLEVSRLALEREAYLAGLSKRNDLLGHNFVSLALEKSYMPIGGFAKLESGVFSATLRALAWYAEQAPELLPGLHERLQDSSLMQDKLLAAYLKLARDKERPENRLKNGDFERSAANLNARPPAWRSWQINPQARFGLQKGAGRKGSNAALTADAIDSAILMQSVKANPGETYLLSGWLRGEGVGKLSLGFRFQDKDWRWSSRRGHEYSLVFDCAELGDWQPAMLFVKVPEEAEWIIVMLSASAQEDASRAFFDDIAVYKLN